MVSDEEMKEFGRELAKLCFKNDHLDNEKAMMMGAMLMKTAMELYVRMLKDEDINNLLDVVAESLPNIRYITETEIDRTIH